MAGTCDSGRACKVNTSDRTQRNATGLMLTELHMGSTELRTGRLQPGSA